VQADRQSLTTLQSIFWAYCTQEENRLAADIHLSWEAAYLGQAARETRP
jgi:hypothetical protein